MSGEISGLTRCQREDTTRIANTSVACSLPGCSNFDITDGEWATYVPTP